MQVRDIQGCGGCTGWDCEVEMQESAGMEGMGKQESAGMGDRNGGRTLRVVVATWRNMFALQR